MQQTCEMRNVGSFKPMSLCKGATQQWETNSQTQLSGFLHSDCYSFLLLKVKQISMNISSFFLCNPFSAGTNLAHVNHVVYSSWFNNFKFIVVL